MNVVRSGTGKGFCGTCGEVGEGKNKKMPEPGVRSRAQASWWSPFPSLFEGREDDIIRVVGVGVMVDGCRIVWGRLDGFIIVSYAICLYL
jgi:hypothetical protein